MFDDILFDSKKELKHYLHLKMLVRIGEITQLETHPRYDLIVCGTFCGFYKGDFRYIVVSTGETILEDVKSKVTAKLSTYRLKKRIVKALYGIEIKEV